jgi:hypothetical protein
MNQFFDDDEKEGKRNDEKIANKIDKFRDLVEENRPEMLKLDEDIQKKIMKIILIEGSVKYKVTKTLSGKLDYFFRFFYLILFLIFVNYQVISVFKSYLLFTILTLLIVGLVLGYFLSKVFQKIKKMNKKIKDDSNKWRFCDGICYFFRCKQCKRLPIKSLF